jgi:hypothetical protein
MYRELVAFILVLSLAACGTKVEENDGAELTSLMQNMATSVETGTGLLPNTEQIHKRIAERVGQAAIVKAYGPPTIVRTNPSVHVSDVTIRADYYIDRKYLNTSWFFKRNEDTSAWMLTAASLKDVHKSSLVYNTEKVIVAALGRMSWSGFNSLEPSSGWLFPNDLSSLLSKAFQALVDNDLETLHSVTLTGALLRAKGKGIDVGRLIAADLPDREFDQQGATKYLEEQVDQTSEIMKYCEAKPEDILPFVAAYSVASIPEACNRVSLEVEYTNPDIGSGITVGNRAMKGFTVEWAAVRVKDVWLIDNLLINCLVTDMAKSFYQK